MLYKEKETKKESERIKGIVIKERKEETERERKEGREKECVIV